MSMDMLGPRMLAWGMTAAGLGIGLMVAAFVGEDTPNLLVWGAALLAGGAVLAVASRFLRSKQDE